MSRRSKTPKLGEPQPAPDAPQIASMGATGLNHSFGMINDEPLLKLKGRRAMKEFREMYDNDAVVGGVMRLATEMVSQTEYSIEAAGDDPATDLMAQHLCETSLDDMQSTWPEFIDDVMTQGTFGHAYTEMWFKKRLGDHELVEFNSKYGDGYYGIGNIALRAQESLDRWSIGDDGRILGMWQRPAPTYALKYIDIERALLFRTNAAKNNPEGRSWLRPGWRSWFLLKRFQEIEGIGVERNVSGYPDFQVPIEYFLAGATVEQRAVLAEIKKMAERIRQDKLTGVVRPGEKDEEGNDTGFAFGLIQGTSTVAGIIDPIIKRLESRVAISMLGEIVLIGQDGVGSLALSKTKKSMLAGALGAILRRIEDVINRHLFPRLVRANGLPGRCAPTLKFEDVESADEAAFAAAVAQLVGGGVLTPDESVERYVRDYLNLPALGDVSPGQLEDAMGAANERVNGAEDPGLVDAPEVGRAQERAVPAAAPAAPAQMPLPLEQAADSSPTMSADECAAYAGVSRNSIIGAIRRGALPGAKVGMHYRVPREDFMAFMRGKRTA